MKTAGTHVAKASEIAPGTMRLARVKGVSLAVCNVDGTYYAIENVCSHDDGPLGEGSLKGFELECPRHGGRFDARTGRATRMPAIVPVRTFPITLEGGDLFVEVGDGV